MKLPILLSTFIFLTFNAYAQGLDQSIKMAANDIGQKITKKNKTKIAVADFVNNAGKSDALTKYVTEQFEMGLINSEGDLQVMDRKHIQQLLSDNHLQSEGLIDESTAKSAVSFIKVDGWAFGEITSFGDQIKISVKIIDVSTSLIYAAFTSEMISDAAIKKFTQSTNEQSEPVNTECQQKNTGDFCFTNSMQCKINIEVRLPSTMAGLEYDSKVLTLDVGQTQCFYDMKAGSHEYRVSRIGIDPWGNSYSTGQIQVIRCKSNTRECKANCVMSLTICSFGGMPPKEHMVKIFKKAPASSPQT